MTTVEEQWQTARHLQQTGQLTAAATHYQAILTQDPHFVPALNSLGTLAFAQQNWQQSADYYEKAIVLQPTYLDAYYNLGLVYKKQQKRPEALQCFQHILSLLPTHSAALFQSACLQMELGQTTEAIASLCRIVQQYPHHLPTLINLATCYLKQGDFFNAKQAYLQAAELDASDTQVLFNLGHICTQLGETDQAIQYYQCLLAHEPNHFAAHNNLGVAFLTKRHISFALNHFRSALRLKPDQVSLAYTINMLAKDGQLNAAPDGYITTLFNAYADHYEAHLLTALSYQLPLLLVESVKKIIRTQPILTILDIGCGTGLCGTVFKPFAGQLDGVDLSANMLTIAEGKKIYDVLHQNNLLTYLLTVTAHYDLIVAGDVLVYTGDLLATFRAACNALKPGGLFVFNTEICDTQDFTLNQSGRFSHSRLYIDSIAKSTQFTVLSYDTQPTRLQDNKPVYGHLYVLKHIIP